MRWVNNELIGLTRNFLMEYNDYDRKQEYSIFTHGSSHVTLSLRIPWLVNTIRHSCANAWSIASLGISDTIERDAGEYQVSRKFLYQQRDKAGAILLTALAAEAPGPKPASGMLAVDTLPGCSLRWSDSFKGIHSGVEQAELCVPLRPDLFHLLREASVLMLRLEQQAYKLTL